MPDVHVPLDAVLPDDLITAIDEMEQVGAQLAGSDLAAQMAGSLLAWEVAGDLSRGDAEAATQRRAAVLVRDVGLAVCRVAADIAAVHAGQWVHTTGVADTLSELIPLCESTFADPAGAVRMAASMLSHPTVAVRPARWHEAIAAVVDHDPAAELLVHACVLAAAAPAETLSR